ncbi:MAG TPA: chemotaxis protein CheB [Humisphaera sp.]
MPDPADHVPARPPPFAVVVVGGSAGSIPVLQQLLGGLTADVPAAVLIVVHQAQSSPGALPAILSRAGPLPAKHAEDGEPLRPGVVYVSPPDRHLMVEPVAPHGGVPAWRGGQPMGDDVQPSARLRVSAGPKENRFRPAIDPLFRTAARAFGRRVVGVVLSGMLDDGTLGLMAVKRHGGVAVVQDPADADCPDMPATALRYVPVDHAPPARQLAGLLARLAPDLARQLPAPAPYGVPTMPDPSHDPKTNPDGDVPDTRRGPGGEALDVAIAGDDALTSGHLKSPPSGLTCPECGGAIWQQRDGQVVHFRCHVGHRYTADSFAAAQASVLESTLWAALRMFQEKAALHKRMADNATASRNEVLAERFRERAAESEVQTEVIRRLLLENPAPGDGPPGDPHGARPRSGGV